MNKAELRASILKLRKEVPTSERDALSHAIFEKVVALKEYEDAETILIYLSYLSEVDTKLLIEYSLATGKNVCAPIVIDDAQMVAVEIRSFDKLKKNIYGILEPKDDTLEINKKKINLALVPGSVFDENKNRIGYGKGYFDNFLRNTKISKVALAYDFQILDTVPTAENDVPMDIIVTPSRIIR